MDGVRTGGRTDGRRMVHCGIILRIGRAKMNYFCLHWFSVSFSIKIQSNIYLFYIILAPDLLFVVVLWFNVRVNSYGMSRWSVNLTILFLGRLKLLRLTST